MGLLDPLDDAFDAGTDLFEDTVEAGVDVATDLAEGGFDLATDVVEFQIDAAGNVINAYGEVVKAQVNAAGQVIDAGGNVIGAAKDYLSSPFALLGPYGLPLYGLTKLGGDDPSKAEQIAGLGEGQPNADVILDLASDCERLFEVWRPRMVEAGLNATTTWEQAAAMFDRERGMSFATIRADAHQLVAAMEDLSQASSAQRAEAGTLASTWQGDGGTAAQTYLTGFQGSCATVVSDFFSGAVALNGCADQLEQAVKDKAQALLPLYQESIDGKSPGEVDLLIAASKLDGDSWIATVGDLLGFAVPYPLSLLADFLLDELKQNIAEAARGWLQNVLAPSYDQAASTFVSTCDATSDSVREIYDVAAQVFDRFDPAVFTPLGSGIPGPAPVTAPGPQEQQPTPGVPGGDQGSGTGSTGTGGGGGGGIPAGGGGGLPGGGGGGVPGGGGGGTPGGGDATIAPTTSQSIEDVLGGVQDDPPGSAPTAVPAGLPQGAGWVSDPSTLPQGWTIDPATGQLLPPGAPGTTGDPEVHSPAAGELLDGDGTGDLGGTGAPLPGAGLDPGAATGGTEPGATIGGVPVGSTPDGVTGSVITVTDDGVSLQISADDAGGPGAHIQVTDATGEVTGYRVEIGPDGTPQLVPDAVAAPTVAASPTPGAAAQPAAWDPSSTSVGPATSASASPAFDARADGTAGGAGGQSTTAQAASWAADPAAGAGSHAAPVASGEPAPAQVHSAAATGGSWFDPAGGGGHHDGSGASLASAQTPGGHPAGGAVLAGSDGGSATGPAVGGSGGMAGMGGAGGGSEPQEHRASQQWRVLDDTFADDTAGWASLDDVLGRKKADEGQVDR